MSLLEYVIGQPYLKSQVKRDGVLDEQMIFGQDPNDADKLIFLGYRGDSDAAGATPVSTSTKSFGINGTTTAANESIMAADTSINDWSFAVDADTQIVTTNADDTNSVINVTATRGVSFKSQIKGLQVVNTGITYQLIGEEVI